uniref:Putative cytochrome P450 n=1 Tax=Tanacetum cinerariifolium TaxID=118510 RepID=A0A6L2MDF5_TANCI|nr:putative cytochrome P450 [Tanacetum cinerariifolium]
MPPIITCAAALNPCFNVNGVDFLIESISSDFEFFDDGFASKSKSYFKESLEEMCMCLKDHLDAKERKQDKCPIETPLDFEEDVFDDEVKRNKAIPLSDEEIALDANASSEGTLSPGGPRVEVAELRMLRWTCGKTLLDMIPNGVYRARVEALVVDGLMRRGGLKLRWEDRVKHNMKEFLLSEDMTSDRIEWRARIRLDWWGRIRLEGYMEGLYGLVLVSFVGCFALRACLPVSCFACPCSFACFMLFELCVVALSFACVDACVFSCFVCMACLYVVAFVVRASKAF